MPRPVGVIQKPGLFDEILIRLGVNRPGQPFMLDGDVIPVILVDSGVSFVAAPTPPYQVTDIFTAGPLVAPAAGTVLADTGPLPVGAYTLQFITTADEAQVMQYQWRDVPNTANLWVMNFRVTVNLDTVNFSTRFLVANANERVRITIRDAATAAKTYQSTILARI